MNQRVALKAAIRGVLDGRLSAADCRLLVCLRVIQALAGAAVACLPIPAARRRLAAIRPWVVALRGPASEERIIWAIEASARWPVGTSTCLVRALAAELLLDPIGQSLRVVIGIASPVGGLLKSHAWIERSGRVVVGGSDSPRDYVPLVAWNGGAA